MNYCLLYDGLACLRELGDCAKKDGVHPLKCPYSRELYTEEEYQEEVKKMDKTYKVEITKKEYIPEAEAGGYHDCKITLTGYTWEQVKGLAGLLVTHGQAVTITEENK